MATTETNSINASTTGVVGNTGTGFSGSPATQYNVQVGGATSNSLDNVAPSATSGVPLISQGSSSNPAFGTAVVAGGGTGLTSTTAYGVICGGTTTTGNLQNAGAGSSGQVLTSNGSSALPTWQAAASSGFTTVNMQVFTSTGSNTYTPTSGMKYCTVRIVGAGGGGGGCATNGGSATSAGGGGGAGAYAEGVFSAATIGASQTVTIGTGGSGGSAGANTGGTGGTSSFGTLISCTGGVGGQGGVTSIGNGAQGGAGGTASGSGVSFSISGNPGYAGFNFFDAGTAFEYGYNSGHGAASPLGAGGPSRTNQTGSANAGSVGLQGGGGSGASCAPTQTQQAGGAGGNGICIVTEYI